MPAFAARSKPKASGEREPPRIVGYRVRNKLTVRVRDIQRVGSILDESVTLGVNEGGNIRFVNDDHHRAHAPQDAQHTLEISFTLPHIFGTEVLQAHTRDADVPRQTLSQKGLARAYGAAKQVPHGYTLQRTALQLEPVRHRHDRTPEKYPKNLSASPVRPAGCQVI